MAGGAGIGPVGGNIVLYSFDLSPVGHNVTVGAGYRRIIGEVIGTYFHWMYTCIMRCLAVLMAGIAGEVWPGSIDF